MLDGIVDNMKMLFTKLGLMKEEDNEENEDSPETYVIDEASGDEEEENGGKRADGKMADQGRGLEVKQSIAAIKSNLLNLILIITAYFKLKIFF